MWADRFESDMADLFKLQDQVVAQLANALRYELGMAEAAKATGSQNPDAIDLAMRGWAVMPLAIASKDQVDPARPLFEQALKIDPDNSEALAGKATTTLFEYIYAPRAETDYDAAILGLLDRAIALDRGNIHAYRTKGQYLAISGRPFVETPEAEFARRADCATGSSQGREGSAAWPVGYRIWIAQNGANSPPRCSTGLCFTSHLTERSGLRRRASAMAAFASSISPLNAWAAAKLM